MAAALRLALICQRHGIPWALGNLYSSICWQTQEVKDLLAMAGVEFVCVDFCYWKTPWRKRIGVLFGNCDPDDLRSLRRCKCSGIGVCTLTCKKHLQLTGSDNHGVPWTKRAEPYPQGFASRVAHILLHKVYPERIW